MRWNEQSTYVAMNAFKEGKSKEEIVKLTGMSFPSVRLFYYNNFKKHDLKVKCEICQKQFKSITPKHLHLYHQISFEDYVLKYPNSKTRHSNTEKNWKEFSNPNKGKTYKEIYGEEEGLKKRKIISEKQVGRPAAPFAGTGIAGKRKDTGLFARSTYEANVDRIFRYENKNIAGEFDSLNKRFFLKRDNGDEISYAPDRVDIDGLFCKNAYLEIKGLMSDLDWEKICLFRKQYPEQKLLVISKNIKYLDINYKDLEIKYKPLIQLWETEFQNFRKCPELYDENYVLTEKEKALLEFYDKQINKNITDDHLKFIAEKLVNYGNAKLGKKLYVKNVILLKISNRRKNSTKKSCSQYNYELWELETHDGEKYYVSNVTKAADYCAFSQLGSGKLFDFFENNNHPELKHGKKFEIEFNHIHANLKSNFDRQDLLLVIEKAFTHHAIEDIILKMDLVESSISLNKKMRERWSLKSLHNEYFLNNYGKSTNTYVLEKGYRLN